MKYFLMCVLCLIAAGCATTGSVSEASKLEHASQMVNDAIPYIKGISQAATTLCLQYAEQDSQKRDELKLQIHVVAVNLDVLLTNGKFSPSDVTNALKVKEAYVNNILQGVALAYTATYNKLEENDRVDFAIRILRALAEGVSAATN